MDFTIIIKNLRQFYLISILLFFPFFVLFTGCSKVFYQPGYYFYSRPDVAGLSPKNIWITTPDRLRLHAWLFLPEGGEKNLKAMVAFFHGNAENLTSHYRSLRFLPGAGIGYLILDYRGYGLSEGDPDQTGTILDAQTALRWIHEEYPKVPLAVVGQSLGGAIALTAVGEILTEIQPKLVVIDSSFYSYKEAARSLMNRFWFSWIFQGLAYPLISDLKSPEQWISKISPVPLIVMHGTQDAVVNISLGRKIFEMAKEPKEYWEVPEGKHIEGFFLKKSKFRDLLVSRILSGTT